MLFSKLASILLMATTALSVPLIPNLAERITHELDARANNIVTLGIRDRAVRVRQEIRQLARNADLWNIYLLGLSRMQAKDQSDPLSWYQIAGIHGRPYVAYDGDGPGNGLDQNGYCTHSSPLFLSWHRPYLALFEQSLYANIIDAVNSFPPGADRDRYAAAAGQFRMPYWDWAAAPPQGQRTFPDLLAQPSVQVRTPSGTQTIANPLYSYAFHPVSSDLGPAPFSTWPSTLRYPTGSDAGARSQDNQAQDQIDSNRVSFRDRVYTLLTQYTVFNQFSNEAWIKGDFANALSIETVHDNIHGLVGNGGHMNYIDVAAFDPIFMLHHTMVDRIGAIWQFLNPNSYIDSGTQDGNTFTIAGGSTVNAQTPLAPFYSTSNSNSWTSAGVRYTQTLGYVYPELVNASPASVRSRMNSLYGPQATATTKRDAPNDEAPGALTQDYFANVRSERFALGESYFIYIFFGEPTEVPARWALDPNLAGVHVVFAHSPGSASDEHVKSGAVVAGSVPLTTTLKKYRNSGKLESLEEDKVVPFLKNMVWRVTKGDDSVVEPKDVPGLVVSVGSATLRQPTSADGFPTREEVKKHVDVTQGKTGGACESTIDN